MNTILKDRANQWLKDHEHYPDDPCYEADLKSLLELMEEAYEEGREVGFIEGTYG